MSLIELKEVVKILSAHKFITEDSQLWHNLAIEPGIIVQQVQMFQSRAITANDLAYNLLSSWIDEKVKRNEIVNIEELTGAIRKTGNINAIEELEVLIQGLQKPVCLTYPKVYIAPEIRIPPFNYRPEVLNFVGRVDEIEQMRTIVDSKTGNGLLVSGLGGVGKTELVRAFIKKTAETQHEQTRVTSWFGGERIATLRSSVEDFCAHLGIPDKSSSGDVKQIPELLQDIFWKLEDHFKNETVPWSWLCVVDNVDTKYEEFEQLMSKMGELGSKVYLVITSRKRNIFPSQLDFLDVKEFPLNDAMFFIKQELQLQYDDGNPLQKDVQEICELVQNLPLALQQIASYIKQQVALSGTFSIRDYITELSTRDITGMDVPQRFRGYTKATLAVWDMTISKLAISYGSTGKISIKLLEILAYVSPDHITSDLIQKFYRHIHHKESDPSDKNVDQIMEANLLLIKYSMLSAYEEIFNIHRVVQMALRTISQPTDYEFRSRKSDDVLAFKEEKAKAMFTLYWPRFKPLEYINSEMSHILSFWSRTTKFHMVIKNNEQIILVPSKIYNRLEDLGMASISYSFAKENSSILIEVLGPNHEEALGFEYCLAMSTAHHGSVELAFESLKDLFRRIRAALGKDHLKTMIVAGSLGDMLFSLNRTEECLEIYQLVFELEKNTQGPGHPQVILREAQIGEVMRKLGRVDEALSIFWRVLDWQNKHLGKKHPRTLHSHFDIACCLSIQGNNEKAVVIFEELVNIWSEIRGEEHPETLNSKTCLATVLNIMGQGQRALNIMQAVLKAEEKALGASHPNISRTRELIRDIETCEAMGPDGTPSEGASVEPGAHLLESESGIDTKLFEAAMIRVLGKGMANLLMNSHNFVTKRDGLAGQEQSFERIRREMSSKLSSLPVDHPDRLYMDSFQAFGDYQNEDYEQAKNILQIVCKKQKQLLGAEHPDTIESHFRLALAMIALDKRNITVSLGMLQKVYSVRNRTLGSKDELTLSTLSKIHEIQDAHCSIV